MAEMNELLEEAIERCGELSEDCTDAAANIDNLVERGGELADAIDSAGEETRQHLEDLTAKLDEAEDKLGEAGQEAKGSLDALVARAGELEGTVGELLEKVKSGLAELEAKEKEFDGRLEEQMDAAGEDVNQLGQRMSDLGETISKNLEAAGEAIQEFTDAVDTARQEWAEKKGLLLGAMDDVEDAVREQTGKYCEEIEELLDNERAEVLVQRLANEMLIAKHNAALDVLEQRFEQEPKDQAASAMEPLLDALQELERLCGEHEKALGEESAKIRDKVSEAVQIVEAVRPVLQSAERLG